MRNTLFLLLCFYSVLCLQSGNQDELKFSYNYFGKNDEDHCLILTCNAVHDKKKQKNFSVKVYENDSLIQSIEVKNTKQLKFKLRKDKHVVIQYYKEGFYPRKIEIDTHIPENFHLSEIYYFDLDMELKAVKNAINDTYHPETNDLLITFDAKLKKFKAIKRKTV